MLSPVAVSLRPHNGLSDMKELKFPFSLIYTITITSWPSRVSQKYLIWRNKLVGQYFLMALSLCFCYMKISTQNSECWFILFQSTIKDSGPGTCCSPSFSYQWLPLSCWVTFLLGALWRFLKGVYKITITWSLSSKNSSTPVYRWCAVLQLSLIHQSPSSQGRLAPMQRLMPDKALCKISLKFVALLEVAIR